MKRALLAMEGVEFRGKGMVLMQRVYYLFADEVLLW